MGKNINGDRPTAFPLEQEKLPFTIPVVEEPRPKIAKLVAMITDRVPAKLKGVKGNDPEYWGLADLVSDEMADVALKMGVRKPKTIQQLMKLTKLEREPLQKLLDQMAWVGLIEYNWENLDGKNPNHEKRYVLPQFVPGSAEFFNMRRSQMDEHPQVAAFFERMTFLPLEKITPMVPPGGAGIGMHVIPVEKAIETENEAVGLEKISYWLHKYEGKYAKSMCSCRASRQYLNEGCGDDPESWCIAVGDMATYIVETGRGEYITYDEAMAIFKKAEDNGFVHQITNIDGEQKIFGICNCNVNVCNALRTSQLFNTPNMSRSAYVARVETDQCVACGRCVEYCPAGAVKLGQKLCTKSGPVEYPRQELPDAAKWGPEKWAIDYRDKNRVNCYDTGTAPCKTACPAHIAVQGYLKLAAQGKYREALQLIKRENPFPAVCGRICNRRCEDACTRGTVDQAVAIDEVKRFIAQQDLDAATRFVPEKVIPKVDGAFDQQIAIIGGGPAGLSCAYYLAEKGYRPTVFEKERRLGGMLENGLKQFQRYLPTLQLKKQQLQSVVMQVTAQLEQVEQQRRAAVAGLDDWVAVFAENDSFPADKRLETLIRPHHVVCGQENIAGVTVPVFQELSFEEIQYDVADYPLWVDTAAVRLREIARLDALEKTLRRQVELLEQELRSTAQRVNLFEKVKIPEAKENIRVIGIYLGDQQTSAVVRGKIAKKKLQEVSG